MTNSPVSQSVTINRALIGIVAAILLGGAGICWFFVGSQNMWTGACLKVGLVVAALWLALPTITRRDNWGETSLGVIVGFTGLALFLISKRIDIRIVLPILAVLGIAVSLMRPKSKAGRKKDLF